MDKNDGMRVSTPEVSAVLIYENPIRKAGREHLNMQSPHIGSTQTEAGFSAEFWHDGIRSVAIRFAENMRRRFTKVSGSILFERSMLIAQLCQFIDVLLTRSTSRNIRRAPIPMTRSLPLSHMKSNLTMAYKPVSIFNNYQTLKVSNPPLSVCTSVNSAQKCEKFGIQSEASETDHDPKFGFIYFGEQCGCSEEEPISNRDNSIEVEHSAAPLPLSQIMLTKYSRTLSITSS